MQAWRHSGLCCSPPGPPWKIPAVTLGFPFFLTVHRGLKDRAKCENYNSACEDSVWQTDSKQLTKMWNSFTLQSNTTVAFSWVKSGHRVPEPRQQTQSTREGRFLHVATPIYFFFYTLLQKIHNFAVRFETRNMSLSSMLFSLLWVNNGHTGLFLLYTPSLKIK